MIFPILYILFRGSVNYYEIIVAFYILTGIHWSFFNKECVISYFYKKIKDCSYKLGDTTTLDDMEDISPIKSKNGKNIIMSWLITLFLTFPLYIMSKHLHYNIPLLIFIYFIRPLYIQIPYVEPVVNFLSIYFLKDNMYLFPGLLLIFFSSLVVKHYDQIPCEKNKDT